MKEVVAQYQKDVIPAERSELEADVQELNKLIRERQQEHANILKALSQDTDKAGTGVTEFLKKLSDDIAALKEELKQNQEELSTWSRKQDQDVQVTKILKNKRKHIESLPPRQRLELGRILLKRVILNSDSIVLERRIGEPIVGALKTRAGMRSSVYSYLDLEWLN